MALCSRSLLSVRKSITTIAVRSAQQASKIQHVYRSNDPKLVAYRFMKVNPSSALVRSLYWTISKEDLQELGSKYGKVEYVNYPMSRSGFHRGLAEIKFEDDNAAQEFIAEKKFVLDHQPFYAFPVPSSNESSTSLPISEDPTVSSK